MEKIKKSKELKNKDRKLAIAYILGVIAITIIITLIIQVTNMPKKMDENRAASIAMERFEELGEKNLKKENMEVIKIERKGVEYYYVSSSQNTAEVDVESGRITILNSVRQ